MNSCPCCSSRLLRHIRHHSIYWYCPRCRQEMPVLDVVSVSLHQEFHIRKNLTTILSQSRLVKTN
ncbi:MAG TPA: hypothetical protein DD379_26980 [Cyanobacteria bacterium UBA11162]|nr:hypothetical protein [Cyanobacteria bacterium UBA11162]